MLGLINYGAGNYRSVCNALEYLNIQYKEILESNDFLEVTHIILPGVGAYNDCINRLKTLNLIDSLERETRNNAKFFLGICVGHQILSTFGTEFEKTPGLDLVPGATVRVKGGESLPVPHVGWSEVSQLRPSPLFAGIDDGSTFYFVHSYHLEASYQENVLAVTSYGEEITAAVNRGNIYGVQFHPEKSQKNGLQLLKNFSGLNNEQNPCL